MQTITTQKVNCKDCHRCVRSCPVKAIAIMKGHAQLIDEMCVLCGKCIVECPQEAKQVADQTDIVKQAIKDGRRVILSLAPSFAAAFPYCSHDELMAKIMNLGFALIEETAVGAEIVADFYRSKVEASEQTVISACCPAIVRLITKYYPSLSGNLAPIVSPMLAHGRLIKSRLGDDSFVVFVGPCYAKIAEAAADPAIDAVLTFNQLRNWLDECGQELATAPDTGNAQIAAFSPSRLFPIAGGILQAAFGNQDIDDIISVDGIRQCMLVFDSVVKQEIQPRFIEALACIGGCINGPAGCSSQSLPAKRRHVSQFAAAGKQHRNVVPDINFNCEHLASPVIRFAPGEDEIREVLRQSGKFNKQDEKNCGACGYNSCRDNAVAVLQGLTEIDTCVPYMRTKAESFANIIVDNSLNAIIVLDEKLVIQEFNPAAAKMFSRQHELEKGLALTRIMDCSDVIAAITEGRKASGVRMEFPELALVTEKMIVPVSEHRLVFLIFYDVTDQERRGRELEKMKLETIGKAKDIINNQMHVAQEIAGLLGETTAGTKSTLLELIAIMQAKGGR